MTLKHFILPSLAALAALTLLSIPSQAGVVHWVPGHDPDQIHLFNGDTKIGTWRYHTQKWYPYDSGTQTWGPACPPPFPVNETPIQNFGVDRQGGKAEGTEDERWVLDGQEVSKDEAVKAIQDSALTDDSKLPWLVWVGDEKVGSQVEADLAQNPDLAKMPVRFQSYSPGEFGACDRDGKPCYAPGLTAVLPNRVAVWHLDTYPGPQALAGYVRKLSPDYDINKVPAADEVPVDGSLTIPATSLGLLSLLGSLLLFRKPKKQ